MSQSSIGDILGEKANELKKLANNNKNIKDLKTGEKAEGFYLIKGFEIKKTTNGKQYIDLVLVDKTGEINAKIWDYTPEIEQASQGMGIVKVRGEVLDWNGSKQFKINKIRAKLPEDNITISDLIPSSPIEPSEMMQSVKSYIKKIKDDQIKTLTQNIYQKYSNKLMYYPAAKKNHHSYLGGLLYHTLRMLYSGEKLGQVYGFLNMDYVYAGILLHDICKIIEMDADEYGIVSDYNMEGKLLGHIIQGIKEIEIEGQKINIDREKSIVLQHMVLSHHYEPEFGSPKKPMTPEAELLHFLDTIDARMFDFEHALEAVNPGEFSEKIWLLDNRNLYKLQQNDEKE